VIRREDTRRKCTEKIYRGETGETKPLTPIHERLCAAERIPCRALVDGVRGEHVDFPERHRGAPVFGAGDGDGAVACGVEVVSVGMVKKERECRGNRTEEGGGEGVPPPSSTPPKR